MTSTLKAVGDRMLARLAPQTKAAGGCPPDPYVQYWCDRSTGYSYGFYYSRNCSTNLGCKTFCGAWTYLHTC